MIGILRPAPYVQALIEGLALMTRHARLTIAMARRELTTRYAGQFIGAFWIIGHPLFLTLLYVFVFGVVFKQRVGGTREMPLDYTSYILIGLIPWLTMVNSLATSPNSIIGNGPLVKQFNFHLEVLPAKDVLISCVTWVVGMSATLIYIVLSTLTVSWMWLLLPFAFLLQLMMMVGIAFFLSAVTVFFRDMKDFMTVFVTAGIFLIPVVYLPTWVPTIFKPVLYVNPFSYMTWVYQDILYFQRFEHPWAWLVYLVSAIVIFAFGYRVFRRLRPMFGSAL